MDIERFRQILKELNPIFWNDRIESRLQIKNPPIVFPPRTSPEDFVDKLLSKGNFPNKTPIDSALGRYLLVLSDETPEKIRTNAGNLCRELLEKECLAPYDRVFEVLQKEFPSSFAQQVLFTHENTIRNLTGLNVRTKDWWACIVCMSHKDFWADLDSTKQKNEQIPHLIAQGEGHTLEFKETLEYSVWEKKQDTNLNKECLKTIAAFLNADGGTLLIGVRDNGEIKGIERDLPYVQRKNEDGFQLKLRDLIKSNFTPFPSGKVDIRFEKHTKETVCRVDVDSVNKNQIIHLGKDVYIRDGNMTRKLEGPDLTYWAQQRGK